LTVGSPWNNGVQGGNPRNSLKSLLKTLADLRYSNPSTV
jgi:hypothetical protein